ncbi:hypothetical protein Ocin01_06471 [Orchesella cincta]|uniref:Uncharacterized protein n=1 Tax=Orchesella cincta TaxID=48709 RepID=A0A1D2N4N5_ORCCI|nr:hypothetical protein Ocin01_06471 [Orchesella cincta]
MLVIFVYIFGGIVSANQEAAVKHSREYVRLPLLVLDNPVVTSKEKANGGAGEARGVVVTGSRDHLKLPEALANVVKFIDSQDEQVDGGEDQNAEDDEGDEANVAAEGDDDDDKGEEEEKEQFDEIDLIEFVEGLEQQAEEEERTGIFPEILDILHGTRKTGSDNKLISTTVSPIHTRPSEVKEENELLGNSSSHIKITNRNNSMQISCNEDGDLILPTEDLSEFSDEIFDGITAGIEESLRMSDDLELDEGSNLTFPDNSSQTRQFSVYLFQGQYYAEPRLNRFIDGALRNMGTELRVASMDPLYFRVLPRGQVAERAQPIMTAGASGVRRRRPVRVSGRSIVKRQVAAFFRPKKKKQQQVQQFLPGQGRKKIQNQKLATRINNVNRTPLFGNRRRQQILQQQRRRRQQIRQQKLQQKLRRKKQQQQQKNKLNKNNKKKQQMLLQRIRRRIRQDVGGGRIEGLSRVERDGDAEMQLFGNYTLIRSHMKMGPLELTMQFRTTNGIRRSGATLPVIRAHSVVRVNHEGSEMVDYLLDRPHPEMIHVRGTIFPLAQRIARNIFARLFLPNSFLVHKLREKAGLAYLSKPVERKR